ncbi:MAG: transcriptional regulator with PAS, ATPase and Fis domain [Flammeovirgaceae bacterium]|jgi:transcriptional regulator with PAS, ATPase and Fis domain
MDNREFQSIKQRFGIIGNSSKLMIAIRNAVLVAPTEISILITGESGSGKESFSKIIHQMSSRKHGEFIAVNCGAIPVGTIDSELFGHEKGAFTGATDSRKGYFEVTDGGTIFLDEIGEMPLGTQARLLRVLENNEFIRVGSSKTQKTNVRVVAATNVDLTEKIKQGKFREDLFYRLSGVHIIVPPLRERGDDIHLLFRKFASDFSEAYRTKPIALEEDAKEVLLRYRFPGNIRQLRNLVNQISVLETETRSISAEKLRSYLPKGSSSNLPALISSMSKVDLDSQGAGSNYSDRDLLYKILFDMRSEVTELKKIILSMLKRDGESDEELMEKHEDLFHNIDAEPKTSNGYQKNYSSQSEDFKRSNSYLLNPVTEEENPYENEKIEDITHREEEESLSLQDKEKELIIKALKKHNNRRKYAADELGISQRTLYRKIKQYDIGE